jgi:ATP adenylyltransferase
MMKRIWAPWRMTYIQNDSAESDCPFCHHLQQDDGPENLILHRGDRCFIILNRYPYTNGHLMVVPYEHKASLEDLDAKTLNEMMGLAKQTLAVLRAVYGAQAFNVGINIGEAAGAGVADHVHLHVVPRWDGDTNFMSSTAHTRVLPETLEDTYQRLHTCWLAMNRAS